MTAAVARQDRLTDDEERALNECVRRVEAHRGYNAFRRLAYEAANPVKDLGISIPPALKRTEIAVGWPGLVVDALDERLDIDRVVMPGGDVESTGAVDVWTANELDLMYPEAHLEALIHGVAFLAASPGYAGEPDAVVTLEPPSTMSGIWDTRRRDLAAAASVERNEDGSVIAACLYGRTGTVIVEKAAGPEGPWTPVGRTHHDLGRPMVRRLVNRPRGSRQWGRSEITRPILAYTGSAARTLLGAEVAREFTVSPQRWVMGANEDDFRDENGNRINPWKAYLGRILALSVDEDTGQAPTVGQFEGASPAPYIDLVKMYAQLVAGEAGLPAHYMGFVTENPASADQIRAVEARHVKRAERRQSAFGAAWRGILVDALTLTNGRDMTAELAGLRMKWRDPGTPTAAAAADRTMKLTAAGILPATSDVVLEELGYDETDIGRIRDDRRAANGPALAASIRERAAAVQSTAPDLAALAARRTPVGGEGEV